MSELNVLLSNRILMDDGHAQLYLVRSKELGLSEESFGIGAKEVGGFLCVIGTKKSWEEMKRKVDAYLEESKTEEAE